MSSERFLDGYTYTNELSISHTVPLAHMDFLPACLEPGGVFTDKQFERFDVLMGRANEWMRHNTHLKVKTCESIELKKRSGDHGDIDTEKVTFYEYGENRNKFIRALRLWLVAKDVGDVSGPQQIGHVNIIPACSDPGGVFSSPKFESFGITLEKLNTELRQRPIPGRILNIETQDMKFHTWTENVDPDETYWSEAGKHGTYFLNVIRIFFELGPPANEEIGCADFVPAMIDEGGFMSSPKFQFFNNVVAQARAWIGQQCGIRVCSLQSIDYKLKSSWSEYGAYRGDTLDTHRTMFYERGEGYTYYLRIIRVSYVRAFATHTSLSYDLPPPPQLNYRTFSPVQLTKDAAFSTPRFESMSETIQRVTAWLNVTGVKVLSSETVPVRLYSGNQHGDHEQTYTWNHGDRSETWLYVVRVYIDGDFEEPPPEALPPVPEVEEEECDCCSIS